MFEGIQPKFYHWLDSSARTDWELVLMELALAKLPNYLESQMRNLNFQTYDDLTKSIVHHIGNSKSQTDKKEPYHYGKEAFSRFRKMESKHKEDPAKWRREGPQQWR